MDAWLKDGVTLAIALLGAVLGVMNAWRSWNSDRVRVRVTPHWTFFQDGREPVLGIEAINLSAFPVTINGFGLAMPGKRHAPLFGGHLSSFEKLPIRLEARASLTFLTAPGTHENPTVGAAKAVIVYTACGLRIRGTSGAFRSMVKEASAAKHS